MVTECLLRGWQSNLKKKKNWIELTPPTPLSKLFFWKPISDMNRAITYKDYSLTFPPLSIVGYSFIQLNELSDVERMKMPNFRNGNKGDSNPGSLDCKSGILSLSYCAPQRLIASKFHKINQCRSESESASSARYNIKPQSFHSVCVYSLPADCSTSSDPSRVSSGSSPNGPRSFLQQFNIRRGS